MSRNFGHRKIIRADEFSPYDRPDARWPFYVVLGFSLCLVGIGVFIA